MAWRRVGVGLLGAQGLASPAGLQPFGVGRSRTRALGAGMGVGEGGGLAPLQEAMVLSWSISFLLLFFHDCFTLF